MPNVKIYSSRNKSKKEQQNLLRMGRIFYDLMEVGPWRIDFGLLDNLKAPLDFFGEENVFHRVIMAHRGPNLEFIFIRISDDKVYLIWQKEQATQMEKVLADFNAIFRQKLKRLFDRLQKLEPSLPEFRKLEAANGQWFSIPRNGQIQKDKSAFPKMPADFGACLAMDGGKVVKLGLSREWMGCDAPPNFVAKFIPFKLNIKISDLPGVKEYLAAKNNPEARNILSQPDYKKLLLEADNMRSRLKVYPETMLTDSNQGHWDLHWPADAAEAEKWYEPLEAPDNFRARNPKNDISRREVAIDFGTTGTVAAVFNDQNRPSLLRIGAQEKDLRENISPEHYVNPTVISIENYEKLLEDWQDVPYRPRTSWNDIQCSHQAMNELSDKVASGLAGIKTWARCKTGETPALLTDAKGREVPLPVPAPQSADDITEDFATLPLNPIELYAFFLGLSLNNQMIDGGRIYTRYYLTFPARFEKETRKRILDGFRRGLLRSLPPGLVFGGEWTPSELVVEEWGSEPAAYAAAILPLLNANEEATPEEKEIKKEEVKDDNTQSVSERLQLVEKFIAKIDKPRTEEEKNRLAKLLARREYLQKILTGITPPEKTKTPVSSLKSFTPIVPTASGVPFGIFDFGGGTTDMAIGLYRTATDEENEEEGWEKVIDILDTNGAPDLGGEALVRRMIFEVVKANLPTLLKDGVIPFEHDPNMPHTSGTEEVFAKSIIARENSRKLGEKLRPVWHKGKLENDEQRGQISETFRDAAGNRRENIILNVDVPALVAMLREQIAKGVDEFFTTFGQAMNKYDVSTNVFHIVLAGNSSRSPLVMDCFREKIAEVLGKNETGDKIILHPPLMPDPAHPEAVTLKTGVAIGLLHILPGRDMGMVTRQNTEEEAYFPFTLGPMRDDALKPVLKRNAKYGEWQDFGKVFRHGKMIFYYSDSSLAVNGTLGRKDCREGEIDWGSDNFKKLIVVAATTPTSVTFALKDDKGKIDESSQRVYELK